MPEKLHFVADEIARRMRGIIIRKTREVSSERWCGEKVLPAGSLFAEGPRRNYRREKITRTAAVRSWSAARQAREDQRPPSMMRDLRRRRPGAFELADWLALTTRLRNGVMPYQQLIADCNP